MEQPACSTDHNQFNKLSILKPCDDSYKIWLQLPELSVKMFEDVNSLQLQNNGHRSSIYLDREVFKFCWGHILPVSIMIHQPLSVSENSTFQYIFFSLLVVTGIIFVFINLRRVTFTSDFIQNF